MLLTFPLFFVCPITFCIGNGQYSTHAINPHFRKGTATDDVRALHDCVSHPMFKCLAEMVRNGWKEAGERKMADTFFHSYVDTTHYNMWFCAASGLSCCVPSNNPNERNTLSIKGSKTEEGMCDVGKDFGSMLRLEWPTMIYKLSLKNIGVTRHHMVDNKDECLRQGSKTYEVLMAYNQLFDKDIDIIQAVNNNEVTYMNTYNSLGDAITTKRIRLYENAIRGETELNFC